MTAPNNDLPTIDKETLAFHGFKLLPRSQFETEAPQTLVKRAKERALQFGGYSWVVWDTQDDGDAWFLIGDNEARLLTEWADAWPDLMNEDY